MVNQFPKLFEGRYEYLLREVLESIDDIVLVFDHDYKIVYANRAAEDVFGRPLSKLLGKDTTVLLPKGNANIFRRYVSSLDRSSQHSLELQGKKEFIGKNGDGHTFYAEGKLAKLRQGQAHILVLRDISWKRLLESELEHTIAHLRAVGHKIEYRFKHPKILDEFPVD